MTMREECIDAILQALDGRWPLSKSEERVAATAALDAILAKLKEPDAEMKDAAGALDDADERLWLSEDCYERIWQAMLSAALQPLPDVKEGEL